MKKVRSKHFIVTGAIGGFLGFILMEILRALAPSGGSWLGEVVALALQFAGFGLAVGAALGMTEGYVLKKQGLLIYGLVLGFALGGLGGCAGGAVGQTIFSLLPSSVPEMPGADVAIALDSSGSMGHSGFFGFGFGSDPDGKRMEAARKLVELLGPSDRVAVIDFNNASRLLFPLTALDSETVRLRIRGAIDRIGSSGGTSLDAGIGTSLTQLVGKIDDGRPQHVIFLTDGRGNFHEATIAPALENGIKIHTIGLGPEVNRELLEDIAERTGGRYYPVENADDLWKIFETIYHESIHLDMASHRSADVGGPNPILHFLFRVLSWGAMGVVIGAGQGIRENTREDLRACTLGGLAGGLIGGAVFNPISGLLHFGAGVFGRSVADVVVGACIGGSMRLAQTHLVELKGEPTTTLLTLLPEKSTGLVELPDSPPKSPPGPPAAPPSAEPPAAKPDGKKVLRGLVLRMKTAVEGRRSAAPGAVSPVTASAPVPPPPAAVPAASEPATPATSEEIPRPDPTGRRKPLSFFQSRYPDDRSRAMAGAFQSGHYSIDDVAEHFGVQPSRVIRAVRDHRP